MIRNLARNDVLSEITYCENQKRVYASLMHTYDFYTAQQGPHHDLVNLVRRFKNTTYQRPIPATQESAFLKILNFVRDKNRPIIIDSGCGCGQSSLKLAEIFPDHDVIGIDKSQHRLSRRPMLAPSNLMLLRAELIDVWRLLKHAQLPIARHYLLYPNPWPKIGHLKRRFYAHPIFTTMVSLAPYLEVRTNWRVYADELMLALFELKQKPNLTIKEDGNAISLFEKKYLASACEIFVITNQLIDLD